MLLSLSDQSSDGVHPKSIARSNSVHSDWYARNLFEEGIDCGFDQDPILCPFENRCLVPSQMTDTQ